MKRLLLLFVTLISTATLFAQNKTLTGTITDAATREAMVGATVVAKGTQIGTATDANGKFSLVVPAETKMLTISYVGYTSRDIPIGNVSNFTITLETAFIPGGEVVVTSSRVAESIKQAPVQIEKMTSREIKSAASGDYYQSISNFKGIDIVTTSAGFKVLNLRGFGDTRSLRTKQFVDGLDNEAPGLNFPVGNMVGANDLDLESVEVVSGAASALYGANAMQGVISMTSKSPYDFKGLGIQVKGGANSIPGPFFDAQIRYANTFGKKNKFAIKFTGEYLQTLDWTATDDSLNRYGAIEAEVNVSEILRKKQYDPLGPDFTQEDKDQIIKLNSWLDFNPIANPGIITVNAPGYMEKTVADYNVRNLKFAGSLHYRFTDNLELTGQYKFGYGTAVYQATARYQIKDFKFHQPMLQLKGKSFFVRAYGSIEDAGNSYNLGLTGAYISRSAVPEYVSRYVDKYFDVIDTLTDGFCPDCVAQSDVEEADRQARKHAQAAWYPAQSRMFNDTMKALIKEANSLDGTKFYDKSALIHVEGMYSWDFVKWLDILTGASYRIYMPNSRGTILEDTASKKIRVHEVGAYLQATKRLFNDNFKIIGSVRVDKNSNFKAQVSPRGSLVYTAKGKNSDHTFRFSATSAFRTPTLQDQYLLLDIGRIKLVGNLNGYDNLYTLESVNEARDIIENSDSAVGGSQAEYAVSRLEPIKLKPLRPEHVTSFELGYRAEINKKVFIDVTGYYSIYRHFIGFTRVAWPNSGDSITNGVAGEDSGNDNVLAGTGYYTPLQTWVNADSKVPAWGAVISIQYYVGKGITPYVNYTYADLNDKNIKGSGSTVLAGFNTPRHKFNIGVSGHRVWKGLGFSANFKWVDTYKWQSPFADGTVPSYHVLDLQLSYEIEKAYSTIRLGASNVYNNMHIEAVGSPEIGGLYYVGWTFDFTNFGKTPKTTITTAP